MLIEAAGNVVFLLDHELDPRRSTSSNLELFRPIVSGRAELVAALPRARRGRSPRGDGDAAAAEVFQLAAAQEARLLEALR